MSSVYLLDTNICIYLIREQSPVAIHRLTQCQPGKVGISSVTLSELTYGIARSSQSERNQKALDSFLLMLEIWSYDFHAARLYGPIRAHLEQKGTPIGPLDTLIAAHALALEAVAVTNNEREFRRVPGLLVENWTH